MPSMLSFRRSLISAASALALLGATVLPAMAVGPTDNFIRTYTREPTYAAVITALTPAASATDIFTVAGSATKTIYIHKLGCTGTSTAAGSQVVGVYTRTVADTGGTATAPTILRLDSTDPASTATVAAYTANPTIAATGAFGPVLVGLLQTPAPASIGATNGFFYAYDYTDVLKPITLRGANQQVAVSMLGVSGASGIALTCEVEWTEH